MSTHDLLSAQRLDWLDSSGAGTRKRSVTDAEAPSNGDMLYVGTQEGTVYAVRVRK